MTTRRQILVGAATASSAVAAPAFAQVAPEGWVRRRAEGPVGTPEQHGAVGDGVADDTEAVLAWARGPAVLKVAPPGRTYRITRPLDLTDLGHFDLDFAGSTLRLAHPEGLAGDGVAAYGLHLPARHALRNVTVAGLGRDAMQSGAVTPAAPGGIVWENVRFRDLQRRAFHLRTDNFLGIGEIRVSGCQTFPGPLPEGYAEGAGRFNCRNFTVDRLWGEGGSRRCFSFGDPLLGSSRDAIESGFVGHVYVPFWETLGRSGQALYANFGNSITFARVDVLDYHCDVSSAAVYFSRDCRDIAVLAAHVSARGHPLTTALQIGGGKRVRVANAYLRSEGRVLRVEGHRHNHHAEDITVDGVFHCHIPEGRTLVEPPILLRNNTLGSGPDRDLRGATIRGRCVLTGGGGIVPPGDRSEQSARGCFLMVGSCTGTVTLDGIEMDTGGRADVIPIGIGSTGSVARVVVRDMDLRTAGQPGLAAWKGEVRVQGGSVEGDGVVIWAPPDGKAVCRVQGLDAGRGHIALANRAGHLVTGCIVAGIEVPPEGIAAQNVALAPP
jgi:hypothetical protein